MANGETYTGKERRRDCLERRAKPPQACERLCIPILDELKKRDNEIDKREERVRRDNDRRDSYLNEKLRKIFECLEHKVHTKLFYWVMGGIISAGAFFAIVVVGGTLWTLSDEIHRMSTSIKVMSVTVDAGAVALKDHLLSADQRYREQEIRIDKIEKGETYYEYYNRELDKLNKIP